ncbi:uncharacterized protein KRP23_5683 [Phytophthora ramorum]|uniref:uncharacterized protein n=1 Tax=Phytophthora ramorum TaxID=164328 RepID=UPI0030A9EDB1|nr:hypothetical protein KRP23_5683 [Phytophthora ramorum]
MAFLEDDDAVRAFEAALSFVEQYSIDTSVFTASPSGFSPAEDIELLSPSLTPAFSAHMASPGAASDVHGITVFSSISALERNRCEARTRSTGCRTSGRPQQSQERTHRAAFLREKVAQLELELTALQLHPRAQTRAIRQETQKQQRETKKQGDTMSVYDPVQVPTVWKEIKMARGLESLLQKRAKQQVVECSSLSQTNKSKYSQGRTLDFRADVNDFKDLLAHLDRAYREVDTVFASNGLATMESTHRDARMREGADCMYLDIYANKVMPFGMRATAQAVWDHFKGAEKHRGNMYEGKVAKHLATPDTPDTIIEDFAKEFFADSSRADFHAKQQVLSRLSSMISE